MIVGSSGSKAALKPGDRVVGELADWKGHSPGQIQAMREGLARLAEQGVKAIND